MALSDFGSRAPYEIGMAQGRENLSSKIGIRQGPLFKDIEQSFLKARHSLMPFFGYEPVLMRLMECAREDACAELRSTGGDHGTAARMMMSLRLMQAVGAGERDPERLKLMALNAVDGRGIDE